MEKKLIKLTFEDGWSISTTEKDLIDIYVFLERYDLVRETKIDIAGVVYAITLDKPLYYLYGGVDDLIFEVAALDKYKDAIGLTDQQKAFEYNELLHYIDMDHIY